MPYFIPDVPGVPLLLRDGPVPSFPPFAQDDGVGVAGPQITPRWGIYKNGRAVIVADTVIDFAYRQDSNILDYPVEDGGFQTYNKVEMPFDVRLRFAVGGSDIQRAATLSSIETIADNLELYDAVMPERIYQSVNVAHFDFQRRYDDGVGLLKIDVWLTEVRVTAKAAFTTEVDDGGAALAALVDTQSPASASTRDEGTLQVQEPTIPQADMITRAIQEGTFGQ